MASAVLLGVPDLADFGGWGSRNSTPWGEKDVCGLGLSVLNQQRELENETKLSNE